MILTYHQLEKEPSGDLYRVTCGQIAEQLQMLRKLHGADPSGPEFHVTFDDGHISNYEHAIPLLQQYGFKAIFFVPAGWIEQRSGTMSWGQLREIIALGHKVQSHSWSHAALTHCSDSQLRQELHASRLLLEDKLGAGVDSLSAPYGRWDGRVLRACRESGYARVYTSDPWLAAAERQRILVGGRLTIRADMNTAQIRDLMMARGPRRMLLQSPFVMKQALKQIMGDRLYHKLWCWWANRSEPAGYGLQ